MAVQFSKNDIIRGRSHITLSAEGEGVSKCLRLITGGGGGGGGLAADYVIKILIFTLIVIPI